MRYRSAAIAVLALTGVSSGWGDSHGTRIPAGDATPAHPGGAPAFPGGAPAIPAGAPAATGTTRAASQREAWLAAHPAGYRQDDDPARRILYATCAAPGRHAEIRNMLAALAEHQSAFLFGSLPADPVFVAIASPADVAREIAGAERTDGMYEHGRRRIVSSDSDLTLRHEWTHAMHHAHMDRIGQAHAAWVQEGLATLYERYELSAEGQVDFPANDRHEAARRIAARRSVPAIGPMLAMSGEEFAAAGQATYPLARSVLEFMADRGLLRTWYRAYAETFGRDPTGRAAIEAAFGMRLADFERAWREWATSRPASRTAAPAAQPGADRPRRTTVLRTGLDRPGSVRNPFDRALPASET